MGVGESPTTVVTEDTSDTISTEGTCRDIARHWHRAGMCSGLPQSAIQNGGDPPGLPHGRPHEGRGLCLAASCAFLGHEFMAAGPWRDGGHGLSR